MNFKADKQKQILYGPFLIPNMLIYRRDDQNGEYYVRFSSEEIEKIATKFNEDLNNKNINFMHTDEKVEAFVAQNWVIEGDQDKSKSMGFDLPEGTWFGAVRVKDDNFWNDKVKTNEVKGFSVEILADLQLSLKNKKQIMEKIDLGSAFLGDGTTPIFFDGEDIAVGTAIFTDEAMTIPAEDDRWVLADGRTIVVVGGMVESVEGGEEMPEVEEMAADPVAAPAPAPEMPAQSQALTSEEVSQMIDARFSELMEEITKMKSAFDSKQEEFDNYKKQVEEKFSTTPAVQSIAKTETKIDDKFKVVEDRIKAFAKNK